METTNINTDVRGAVVRGAVEAVDPEVRATVRKWYERLGFSKLYDEEFYRALDEIPISDRITLEDYPKDCTDGLRNLLSYLWLCERTAKKCAELGIPESIVVDTLSDIVIWTDTWSAIKKRLYLGELPWLALHLDARLFRLGRLQFCMAKCGYDIPKYGIEKGDPVIEIHIPRGDRLTPESCTASINTAREFFARFFPNYNYKVFTCGSWLLDETLEEFLSEESGIIRFGRMFDRVIRGKSTGLIRYLFSWDTTIENLEHRHPTSSLAAKVQKAVLEGKQFYGVLGVIEK